jgi:hypothetical protein
MTEENFPFAAEAKQAIAKSGYFLVGTDAVETIGRAARPWLRELLAVELISGKR